jgi:hypothetical protein
MVDLTSNRAWAKGVAPTISHEGGGQRPTFARASQNVVAAATLLDMLAAPFTDKVERLYH